MLDVSFWPIVLQKSAIVSAWADVAETDEDVLAFNVADDALERAAAVPDGRAMTIAYCTHWYECGWPL
jgi:hypothetical protein